jgi:hypothetical protein
MFKYLVKSDVYSSRNFLTWRKKFKLNGLTNFLENLMPNFIYLRVCTVPPAVTIQNCIFRCCARICVSRNSLNNTGYLSKDHEPFSI